MHASTLRIRTHISLFIPRSSEKGVDIYSKSAIGKNIDDGHFRFHKEIKVKARTLDSILLGVDAGQIDLLSIDVEGAELGVLSGLSIERYKPKLILLEDKYLYLDKHRYLKKHGYVLAKRTRQNSWYVPIGSKRPPQTILEKILLFKKMYISIWRRKLFFRLRSL